MSEASDFLDTCQARGPMTLRDHLLSAGYDQSYGKYRSVSAAATRLLREDPTYKHLVGTVIFPSAGARGAAPGWAAGAEPKADQVDEPDWASVSTDVIVLRDTLTQLDIADEEDRTRGQRALLVLAKASGRVQQAANTLTEFAREELIRKDVELRAAKEKAAMSEQHTADLREALRVQQALADRLLRLSGDEGLGGRARSAMVLRRNADA